MNPFQIFLLVAGLFLLSLFGAYIIFKFLKGRAGFKHQGISLGGSAAGFVIFFWLLQKVFFTALDKIPAETFLPLEVIAFGQEGKEVLTEIALDPKKLIVSKERFKYLDPDDYTILSDSLNIAMASPKTYNWTMGKLPEYNTISIEDLPYVIFMNTMTGGMMDIEPKKAQYFGARVGIPAQLQIQSSSKVDGIEIGANPFKDPKFFNLFENSMRSAASMDTRMGSPTNADLDTMQTIFSASLDNVIKKNLPRKKLLYSGVYITVYTKDSFKENAMQTYLAGNDLITKAVSASAPFSRELPRLSYLNGNDKIAAYNRSVNISNALVNGIQKDLIINYVGFAVAGDDAVYTVTLQYLSTDSAEVLRELQRFFESVRIVRPKTKHNANKITQSEIKIN